jgi:hypothetical protein
MKTKKITLDLAGLKVTSFEPSAQPGGRGTVNGHSASAPAETCYPDATCGTCGYSCEPGSCAYTCDVGLTGNPCIYC